MSYKFAINTTKKEDEIIVGWTYVSDSNNAMGIITTDDINVLLSAIEIKLGFINDEIEQMVTESFTEKKYVEKW